jgi:hypothetical protein
MSAYGTKQTCSMRRRMSASGGKTDVDQPLLTSLDLCVHALACLLIYDTNGYQQRRSSDRLAVIATKLRHDLAGVFLRVVSRMKSARLAVFGNRETEKEKSPVAHRAFPVLSPVKASCAKKSVTTPNGQRGKTEAPHISRGGLPSRCGKKVTSKGLERDGLGHHVIGAMTSLVIAWFPPKWNPKAPASPRARGFFLLSTEQSDADPSKWRRMC